MKTPEQIASDILSQASITSAVHIAHVQQVATLMADAICADRAQIIAILETPDSELGEYNEWGSAAREDLLCKALGVQE